MSTSTKDIHDLVWEGKLTEELLLGGDRLQAINEIHHKRSLTPLGAAVLKGDVPTIRLLLHHGADVNKPSGTPSRTRTPLWMAVSKMQMEDKIGPIAKILLEAGADPNISSADDKNTAPLLNAVKRDCKPEVITMLVDHKASLTAEDDSGMSAERFAKKKSLKTQSALSANSWRMDRFKAVGMVTGLVLFVVAWSNTTPSQRRRIAAGAALLLLGGAAALSAGQNIAQPTTRSAADNTKQPADSGSKPPTDTRAAVLNGSTQSSGATQPGATQPGADDAAKPSISNPTQSAANNKNQSTDGSSKPPAPGATAVSRPGPAESGAENATEADIGTPGQPAASDANLPVDGTSKPPIDATDVNGSTEPGTENATEAGIGNSVDASAADNTIPPPDGSLETPIGATTQTVAENTAEPVITNGAQAVGNETTEPTASDIQPTNNNAVQLVTSDGDEDDDTALPGAILQRFGMTGEFGNDIAPELKELMIEQNIEEFRKGIDDYITKTGLNRFFPPDDPFLKTVVRKALYLEQDPENVLDVKDLTKLSLYQTVLYLDDSGSMRKDTRRNDLRELVKRIASIATRLLPDGEGVELRFINAPTDASYSKPSLDMIDTIISDLRMWGWTPIGTSLKGKILMPLVYKRIMTQQFNRPMLVSIITDGFPEGPQGRQNREKRDTLKNAIIECGKRLEQCGFESNSVLFQISQIGAEEEAAEFIESLRIDQELDDILYCTTDQLDAKYNELRLNHQRLEQFLFSTLLSPILNADPT
ncbi:hypothetical protein TWF506_004148 [Arthrobotrys conoides]|uniref:Ankyrin repeat protein n=1 Tax=Arthrobotrys conoides TaxID=74498 RepID=A0AAN8NGD9_9PEZI